MFSKKIFKLTFRHTFLDLTSNASYKIFRSDFLTSIASDPPARIREFRTLPQLRRIVQDENEAAVECAARFYTLVTLGGRLSARERNAKRAEARGSRR